MSEMEACNTAPTTQDLGCLGHHDPKFACDLPAGHEGDHRFVKNGAKYSFELISGRHDA